VVEVVVFGCPACDCTFRFKQFSKRFPLRDGRLENVFGLRGNNVTASSTHRG